MVMILPEGRMMRRNGLDSNGQPMTVRGGIADILDAIPDGRMLLAYSGGLHHVQAPGDGLPRLFRSIRLNLEAVDIADYRAARRAEAGTSGRLQARRGRRPRAAPRPSLPDRRDRLDRARGRRLTGRRRRPARLAARPGVGPSERESRVRLLDDEHALHAGEVMAREGADVEVLARLLGRVERHLDRLAAAGERVCARTKLFLPAGM